LSALLQKSVVGVVFLVLVFFVQKVYCSWFWFVTGLYFVSFETVVFMKEL